MKKMVKRMAVIFLCSTILTGCWSQDELTDLAIVTAMAIDKIENEYLITLQVINAGEVAGETVSNRVAISTFSTSGRSIFEAIRTMSKKTPRRLYFAHLRLVIFGEDLAKSGIGKLLDLMSRDHEFRTDFYLLVSSDAHAYDILKVLTPIEKIPANKIYNSIEVSHNLWAPTLGVKLDDLITKITSKGDNPVLTGVLVEGNKTIGNTLENVKQIDSESSINLNHLAMLKKDKLVGWLNEDESKGFNYIKDQVKNTVAVVNWNEGNITLELENTKTKIKVKIKNKIPKIYVNVTTEAEIGEVQTQVDLLDENTLKEIEIKLNELKEEKMLSSIKKAKESKTDIFGFGEQIRKKDPKLWETLKENWNEEGFLNLDVVVNTDSSIRRSGTTNQPFLNDIQGGL